MKVRENLDAAWKLSLHSKYSAVRRGRELRLMDFKLGEKVVYPNHGVGLIEQISFGYVDGKSERFYMLRILSSGLKVMVPQANIESVGLRPVIRSTQAGAVISYLEKGRSASHHDWKHRFKENSDRMRTGSLMEVAAVLKGLVALSRTKPLSFREKKMLERAKYLLVSELATVRNTSEQVVELNIVRALAKAKLQMPEATVLPPD
ncbi:MAG TPA: CarD family transcriptional regulator [Candidatus Acidoferrales bacterium]|nr:CarD family transcriptional regulator [Candidatus Acidoferrales bacterium]